MAKAKYDGVIEAVRYTPEGLIQWVRAYIRRGPVFSDRILLDRKALVDQLRSGKNFMVGQRIPLMASTFDVTKPVRLLKTDAAEIVTTGDGQNQRDSLEAVPVI